MVRTQKKREKWGCSIVAEEAVKYMRAQLIDQSFVL